jgi:protein gp37
MGITTGIEWADATWNPWYGCQKVSPGCKLCYMFRDMKRYGRDPRVVQRAKPATFDAPLKWKDPLRVFTCSWSDFFIEEADAWRGEALEIIRATPRHTYQILTKRIDRVGGDWGPNIWLGVSVENRAAKHRIDVLREIKVAGLRFLSIEPLLEDIGHLDLRGIGWVIVGGKSGPGARLTNPNWIRSIRNQCQAAKVRFFFKQWGEWAPHQPVTGGNLAGDVRKGLVQISQGDGREMDGHFRRGDAWMLRVGKKAAGALLDGREWREFPEVRA